VRIVDLGLIIDLEDSCFSCFSSDGISCTINVAYIKFTLQLNFTEYLESVEVCTSAAVGPFSNLAKKKIRLANYPNNTVIVKLTRWDQFWPSFMNFRCKFQVTAPKRHGVMMVIQSMNLRTKKPNGVLCKDYIKVNKYAVGEYMRVFINQGKFLHYPCTYLVRTG
jgi:hypothetical protein